MGKYKQIRKKAAKTSDAPVETAKHWLHDNMGRILVITGVAILILAIGYGVVYYRRTSAMDAYARLYEAASLVPAQKGTSAQADSAISAITRLIEHGGPDRVMAEAHINIGSLLARKGEFDRAASEYDLAIKLLKPESLAREVALLSKANVIVRAGKLEQAEKIYRKLSESSSGYPRSDALFSLSFVLSRLGKKDEAIGALNKLKSEFPTYQPVNYIDDTIKQMENDRFVDMFDAESSASTDEKDKPSVDAGKIKPSDIHKNAADQ